MRDTWLVPFLSAIGGAVVGALASVWVHRREVTRSARIRMFDELLPALRAEVGSQRIEGPLFVVSDGARQLEALARCAVIAGGRERKLVADLKRGVDDVMR